MVRRRWCLSTLHLVISLASFFSLNYNFSFDLSLCQRASSYLIHLCLCALQEQRTAVWWEREDAGWLRWPVKRKLGLVCWYQRFSQANTCSATPLYQYWAVLYGRKIQYRVKVIHWPGEVVKSRITLLARSNIFLRWFSTPYRKLIFS